MTQIICTVGGDEKSMYSGLLLARDRYVGEHIEIVGKLADVSDHPYYILSDRWGLLEQISEAPLDDYKLDEAGVPRLVADMVCQLEQSGITITNLYRQRGREWDLHERALREAARVVSDFREKFSPETPGVSVTTHWF